MLHTIHWLLPALIILALNGKSVEQAANSELPIENGYIHLLREWNPGDVEYKMEMRIWLRARGG